MGQVIPGRWGTGRSETSPRSKARRATVGTGPPYQLKTEPYRTVTVVLAESAPSRAGTVPLTV